MIPKALYEMLPGLYAAGAVLTLAINDSPLRFFPATLLLFTAGLVFYLRYDFRHLPAKERAQRMAEHYRQQRRKHSL
ncbi:hypothetical protein [Reinekea sp. G2M2-21]|jgi:hypothetical protein|uniref:hypothetical protein n=1 Tax=Reinekea sp. G2M2-21 TaxID=2788942 RepID=UPI0018A9D9B0|nr:hypothetical protein [Reinekea sp. G2M2-21]MDX1343853.1 hypothetical protein [Reinekea sp.]MDX1474950.1 hypothetical protein [Reinekea sp.]